jgi:SAM-dependent methyltransferase
VVVDLGSGDGRISIAAAKDFGARAYGYEYNPDMVDYSKREAEKAGVSGKVEFRKADIFDTDFSHATVITMYLLPHLNVKLRPILLNMRPGIRVVSHQFDMGDWKPDEVSEVTGRRINFWLVPAKVDGDWKLNVPGREYTLTLRQEYQMISGWVTPGPGQMGLRDAVLTGAAIRFSLVDEQGKLLAFNGNVQGNRMTGTVSPQGGKPESFSATKVTK